MMWFEGRPHCKHCGALCQGSASKQAEQRSLSDFVGAAQSMHWLENNQ
jgi:hypothetical protein